LANGETGGLGYVENKFDQVVLLCAEFGLHQPEWRLAYGRTVKKKSYEVINLMARQIFPWRAEQGRLNTDTVKELDVLVAISAEKRTNRDPLRVCPGRRHRRSDKRAGNFPVAVDTPLRRSEFAVTYGVARAA